MSIQHKFLASVALILGFISCFIFLYYPSEYKRYAHDTLNNKVQSMAEMVALGVGTGRELNHYGVILQALDWAKADKNLAFLVVLDEEGGEIASHNPGNLLLDIPRLLNDRHLRNNGDFINLAVPVRNLAVPVRYEKKSYGMLIIGYSLADMNKSIAQNTKTSLHVSMGMFIIGIFLSILIGQRITRPILALKRAVIEYAAGNDRIAIRVESSDEVGDLANSFQSMVEKINRSMRDLKQVNEELQQARDRAQVANKAKSEFLSRMSHELRTPMNAILGFGQLMEYDLSEPLSDAQRTRVGEILKAGNHLLELINEVLDLSRVESGKLSLSIENVDMSPLFDEALQWIKPLADERGIRLVHLCQGTGNRWVRGDRTRLKQILLNLLSNGVKYNREGGTLTLECENTGVNRLVFRVRDTRHGIASNKMDRLFEPFNRLGADQGQVEGTGIGLSIAKNLIELMAGKIRVHSTVGEGSAFEVELPCGKDPESPASARSPVKIPDAPRPIPQASTLLYVEDNPANLRLVEELIASRGNIHLLVSERVRPALELVQNHKPDLILMDMHLPEMDGMAALKLLKADEGTRHIPVIAISANAMRADIDRALEEGFEGYITKPIEVDNFLEIVDKYLGKACNTSSINK